MSGTIEDVAAAVEASAPEPAWTPPAEPADPAGAEAPAAAPPAVAEAGAVEPGGGPPARRAAARARAGRRASLTAELRNAAATAPRTAGGAGETQSFAPQGAAAPAAPTWSLAPVEEPEARESPPPPGVITDPLLEPMAPTLQPAAVVPVAEQRPAAAPPPTPMAAPTPTPIAEPPPTSMAAPPPPPIAAPPPAPVFRLEPDQATEVAGAQSGPPEVAPVARAARAASRSAAPAVEAQEVASQPGVTALDLGGRRRRRSRPTATPPRPAEVFEVAEDASGRVVYIDPPRPRQASPFLVAPGAQAISEQAEASTAAAQVSGWVAVAVLAAALVIVFIVGMRLTA